MNSTEEEEECCGLEMMQKDVHATFLELMYYLLPSPYETQEINHLTLAYFVISGLDILNSLHSVHTIILFLCFLYFSMMFLLLHSLFICNLVFVWFKVAKDAVVSWVLSFQAHPGAKADLNNGMCANALGGSIWSPKFDF